MNLIGLDNGNKLRSDYVYDCQNPMITKTENNEAYALLYHHKVVNSVVFSNSLVGDNAPDVGTGTSLSNVSNLYSRMHKINDWSDFFITGNYTFIYEDVTNAFSNKWSQTINPIDSTDSSTQMPYTAISIAKTSNFNSGLKKSGASTSCRWCCNSGTTWYFPIYQYAIYNGGIPTAGITSMQVRLWVKIPL